MKLKLKSALAPAFMLGLLAVSTVVSAQITFYEHEAFRGRTYIANQQVQNLGRQGYNDRASSVIVTRGRWLVCEDERFEGRCVVLRPGNYDTLSSMGMNDRISSVRPVGNRQYSQAPLPEPIMTEPYEYRRRPEERIREVPVTSVRAVVGPPNERCWVERQQVASQPNSSEANVGGAIAGALLGGILGHQVGGGVGKDIATVGGAVAGGVIGANIGRNNSGGTTQQDVRRCETTQSSTPAYWDVTYNYRGIEHRIQMSTQPGATISVNANGEPRG